MREDVRDALDAGTGIHHGGNAFARRSQVSRDRLRLQLTAVLQELPDDMTVAELRDELQGLADEGGAL